MKLVDSFQFLRFKWKRRLTPKHGSDSRRVCWRLLDKSDASLSHLVEQLDIADAVLVSALILIALQTVAIDSKVPREWQVHILDSLHANLYAKGWNFPYNDFKLSGRVVLTNFHAVIDEFLDVNIKYRPVISNAVKVSGQNYARHIGWSTKELSDWDVFCQDVAGVHGEAFSDILVLAELEPSQLADMPGISQSLAVFLYKTYSITHFYQYMLRDAIKWPMKLLRQNRMHKWQDMTDYSNKDKALTVLSAIVVNTLMHVSDTVEYLAVLTNRSAIRFVGYVVMSALLDIENCFMNSRVFVDQIKVSKSTQTMLLKHTTTKLDISRMINETLVRISNKCTPESAENMSIKGIASVVESLCARRFASLQPQGEQS